MAVGTRFAGYTIEAVAGRGGMGIVYRARQVRPSRLVALKVISPQLASESGFRERFEHESEIAASIEHSNVIPVYEVGEESELLFLAMRYVEGTDLGKLIATEGRLPPIRAVQILGELTAALDAAHERGLVHRDVKPANVLIAREGGREHVYLTDFGLAKLAEGRGQTRTGIFLGTIDYAAPEQFEGRRVDARTDVYACGCVLYDMLTGNVPFPREGEPAIMFAHISAEAPSARALVPSLPPEVDAVIARAMAKDPDARYPSAGDLGRDALAAVSGQHATLRERSVATGAAAPAAPVAGPAAGPADATMAAGPADATVPARPPEATVPASAHQPGKRLTKRTAAIAGAAILVLALAIFGASAAVSGGGSHRAKTLAAGKPTAPPAPTTKSYPIPSKGVSFSYPASWVRLTGLSAPNVVADVGINNQAAATTTRCALLIQRGAAPSNSQEAQFAYVRARSADGARSYKHYELRAIQSEQATNISGVGLVRVGDGQGAHLAFFFRGRDIYLFDCITPAGALTQVDQQDFRPLLASLRVG